MGSVSSPSWIKGAGYKLQSRRWQGTHLPWPFMQGPSLLCLMEEGLSARWPGVALLLLPLRLLCQGCQQLLQLDAGPSSRHVPAGGEEVGLG